jgi:hypothetical protein
VTAGLFDAVDAATKQAEEECTALRVLTRLNRERAERDAKWAAMSDEDILRMRIAESKGDIDPTTSAFLGLTVPMWIETMRGWHPDRRIAKGRELVDIIAFDPAIAAMVDDEARATTKKRQPGKLATGFNAVAQGLACLAYCPGGVVFAGSHWEAKP